MASSDGKAGTAVFMPGEWAGGLDFQREGQDTALGSTTGRAADPELTAAPAWPQRPPSPGAGKCGAGRQGRETEAPGADRGDLQSHLWAINSAGGTAAGQAPFASTQAPQGPPPPAERGSRGPERSGGRQRPELGAAGWTSATKAEGVQPCVWVCETHTHTHTASQVGLGPRSSPQSRGAGRPRPRPRPPCLRAPRPSARPRQLPWRCGHPRSLTHRDCGDRDVRGPRDTRRRRPEQA